MRVLAGTKVVEAGPAWLAGVCADCTRVFIDVGAGDGRFAYERARADDATLYIALDPDAVALGKYAYRASRKAARGGVPNAAYVVAAVEQLPPELREVADLVRVNFPWGGLLRGLLEPRAEILDALVSLAKPRARFELVMSYDPELDPNAFAGAPLPPLDDAHIDEILIPAYEASNLRVDERRRLTQDEALAIPSTWGRRLLHARPRHAYFIAGSIVDKTRIV